jgi:Phage Terminase
MAADAKRRLAREAAFGNLVLNQRVEASSPFVTAHQWKACRGEPLDLRGRDVFGGLDLSEEKDLTALVLIGSDIRDGTWHERPTFWLPSEGLYHRARSDRIPYDLWHTQGHLVVRFQRMSPINAAGFRASRSPTAEASDWVAPLETTSSSSISYEYVAQHLRTMFDQHHVIKLAFVRWNLEALGDQCFGTELHRRPHWRNTASLPNRVVIAR